MQLVDHQIIDRCLTQELITPFDPELVQPCSVDLTLGNNCGVLANTAMPLVVGTDEPEYKWFEEWENYILHPGHFAIFQTREVINMPADLGARFEGKSSLGRIGLMTNVTAGFIDPGFLGVLTLEMYNCGPLPLTLQPGIRIGQIIFTELGGEPTRLYGNPTLGSHYQESATVRGADFSDRVGVTGGLLVGVDPGSPEGDYSIVQLWAIPQFVYDDNLLLTEEPNDSDC